MWAFFFLACLSLGVLIKKIPIKKTSVHINVETYLYQFSCHLTSEVKFSHMFVFLSYLSSSILKMFSGNINKYWSVLKQKVLKTINKITWNEIMHARRYEKILWGYHVWNIAGHHGWLTKKIFYFKSSKMAKKT